MCVDVSMRVFAITKHWNSQIDAENQNHFQQTRKRKRALSVADCLAFSPCFAIIGLHLVCEE